MPMANRLQQLNSYYELLGFCF